MKFGMNRTTKSDTFVFAGYANSFIATRIYISSRVHRFSRPEIVLSQNDVWWFQQALLSLSVTCHCTEISRSNELTSAYETSATWFRAIALVVRPLYTSETELVSRETHFSVKGHVATVQYPRRHMGRCNHPHEFFFEMAPEALDRSR